MWPPSVVSSCATCTTNSPGKKTEPLPADDTPDLSRIPRTAPSGSISTAPSGLAPVGTLATTLTIPMPGPDRTASPADAIVGFDHTVVETPGERSEEHTSELQSLRHI